MESYKVIVIDSEKQRIYEREIERGKSLQGLQEAVQGFIELGTTLSNDDDILVNEEGLLKKPKWFFTVEGAHQPFAGNGVVVGRTRNGDSASCKSSMEDIKRIVKFWDQQSVALVIGTEHRH
jgi:hypothetical protein